MANLNFEAILREALDFRNDQFLGLCDPVNCKSLLLKLNVLTLYRPLSENFSGMCLKSSDKKFMLINSNQSRGRQHFTIAHELYHLFIQQDFKPHWCNPGLSADDINEKIADAFASNFLMPELALKMMIPLPELEHKELSIATILKLEQYFSVSHSATLTRLLSLKLITKTQFEAFSIVPVKKSALEHGYGLALYEKGNEGVIIGDYGVKSKELFDNQKISEGHYIELLSTLGVDLTQETHEE